MASSAGQLLEAGRVPGEWIAGAQVVADSAVFGTAETVVVTLADVPVVAGRTYEVVADPAFASAVDGDLVAAALRQDSLAGTVFQQDYVPLETNGNNTRGVKANLRGVFVAASTELKTFVVTGDTVAGTGGFLKASATHPSKIDVYYRSG